MGFGSFARGEARAESDVDVLAVTPAALADYDHEWRGRFGEWGEVVGRRVGNPVKLPVLSLPQLRDFRAKSQPMWGEIQPDGLLVEGSSPASTADAHVSLTKAQEFSQSADSAVAEELYATIVLDAVHAGILAADASSAIRGGVICKGEHSQASPHLTRGGGGDGKQAAGHLRRPFASEEPHGIGGRADGWEQAESAAPGAQRIVAIATRCVSSAGGVDGSDRRGEPVIAHSTLDPAGRGVASNWPGCYAPWGSSLLVPK